jgi:phosphocarrier protein
MRAWFRKNRKLPGFETAIRCYTVGIFWKGFTECNEQQVRHCVHHTVSHRYQEQLVAGRQMSGPGGMHIRLSAIGFMKIIKERKFMCIKDVMVQNQVGLHARPATFFIQKANEFRSAIWIEKEERRVNAKSLLGILSLGIVGGTAIRIIADGTDEEQAVASLVELVDSGFSDESR